MKRKWTALLLTVCLIFTICSSGCSGAIELNDRVLVKGIGIDVKR